MFLVHRVTTYSISLPHTVMPGWQSCELQEEETIEGHWTLKQQLIKKIQDEIQCGKSWLWEKGGLQGGSGLNFSFFIDSITCSSAISEVSDEGCFILLAW